MIDILIYTDSQKGHIIPTFAFANSLAQQGAKIAYFGIEEAMNFVALNGFETHTIFENEFSESKNQKGEPGQSAVSLILKGGLDELMSKLKPKVIVSTSHDPLETLVLYFKYKLKIFFLWSHFPKGNYIDPEHSPYSEGIKRGILEVIYDHPDPKALSNFISFVENSGVKVNALKDIAKPIDDFIHFVLCSKELLIEEVPSRQHEFYLGPCIFEQVKFSDSDDSTWKTLADGLQNEKYIYCSLGSWADEINKSKAIEIFKQVINSMKDKQLQEYKLLIAAGKLMEDLQELKVPSNVLIYRWLPQLRLLEKAELAIIHGGMGALKECIYHEVPMIVAPLGKDKFENAERVEFHKLGKQLELTDQSTQRFVAQIVDAIQSSEIKERLNRMNRIFKEDSKWMKAKNVIEEVTLFQAEFK